MPAVLLLLLPDGTKKIVPCPNEGHPEEIAMGRGATVYEYFESEDQAKRSIERDPTGHLEWIDA
jgi:hypothetical protein